jgi:hypothetical protein
LVKPVVIRNTVLIFIALLIAGTAFAQKQRRSVFYNLIQQKREHAVVFHDLSLFSRNHRDFKLNKDHRAGAVGTGLTLNRFTIASLLRARHEAITISIPSSDGTIYTLLLSEERINVSGDFSTGSITRNYKRTKTSSDQGLHYRGYVGGDSSSMASLSIFSNGDIMGLFSNQMGNFNIGKADSTGNNYMVYNSNNLDMPSGFECATLSPAPAPTGFPVLNAAPPPLAMDSAGSVPPLLCKKVRVYFEGSYNLYSYNFHSDLAATQNYLLGLFNQVAAMYQNEGIMIELAQTYVWTTPDPYDTTRSDSALFQFQRRWNGLGDNFNGDIAHLITGGTTRNGGIAYLLPDLCNRPYNYAYSNVFGTYNNIPTYSWDVNVITHEMGHLFGSHHTHWCGWNTGAGGTCGAIDNCKKEEFGNSCGSCPSLTDTATRPAGWQGTVMSYCHLYQNIGINLANGFGPLPQAVIRNAISSSACLTGTVESWSGTTNTAWENSTNWSCGKVPDANTDVSISQTAPNYPVINSNAQCHSLTVPSGTSIQVNPGESLDIIGAGTINVP